jgi:hypothetical protein
MNADQELSSPEIGTFGKEPGSGNAWRESKESHDIHQGWGIVRCLRPQNWVQLPVQAYLVGINPHLIANINIF